MSWPRARGQRGVSLIEALVALAVMAFGVLGVIGVQITLRLNADIAKQRAEAVRFAQQAIESWRDYSALVAPVPLPSPPPKTYADVQSAAANAIAGVTNTNTIFTITTAVVDSGTPPIKSLQADVTWNDRNGNQQRVTLFSNIAGVLPEVAGSVVLAAKSATNQQVLGRNTVIPVSAVDNGQGKSDFTPPGGGSINWQFDNTTGLITCVGTSTMPCITPANSAGLSGYISFYLGTSQPSQAQLAAPTDMPPSSYQVDVQVNLVPPPLLTPLMNNATGAVPCFTSAFPSSTALAYYCAVPLSTAPIPFWSGWSQILVQSQVSGTPVYTPPVVGELPVSSSLSDSSGANFKVCRYTPSASATNAQHPLNYSSVTTSLTNQNFVVIAAGNGNGSAFDCEVPSLTLHHQPLS